MDNIGQLIAAISRFPKLVKTSARRLVRTSDIIYANGMTIPVLLKSTDLCCVPMRAYEGFFHPVSYGVIKDVDIQFSKEDLSKPLRSEV